MPIDSDFKNWLDKNKMWIKSTSDKEKTHNVMEFGCFLSIRYDLMDKFTKKLAKTLDNKKPNYFLEIRTDYFKFMVDVDFKSEFGLSSERKLLLLSIIQEAINEIINEQISHNTLIVSACKDEKIIYNDQEMIKIGFHLIWPNLIVGIDEARYLRSAIIQKLDNSNITFLSFGTWENVIDNSIYDKKHALRMNGSSKNIKCPKCKAKIKDKAECIKCNQTGWFNAGRIYYPYLVLDNKCNKLDNILQELNSNNYKNLKMTSIRTNSTKSNMIIPQTPPIWFSQHKYITHINRKIKKNSKSLNFHPFKTNKTENQEDISENDPKYIQLISFLKTQLFKLSIEFSDIKFDKLKKITKNKKNIYYTLSTRNHYCLNVKREHSSNHIYFNITKKYIYQKCPSPWKNNNNELCKDFKSQHILLNKKIYELLFIEKQKITNIIEIPKQKPKYKFSLLD